MEKTYNYFEELYNVNVSDRTYKKKDLTYLSWASAYSELMKKHPDATYDWEEFEDVRETIIKEYDDKGNVIKESKSTVIQKVPYIQTEAGLMVYAWVKVGDITHRMPLPVMDGANKSMKLEAYKYVTKYGDKEVEAASMFDVNKTLMRALTKCIAMHGVALYIYEKDDQPQVIVEIQKLQGECMELIKTRSTLSDGAKMKVAEVCKAADENANGDPRLIEDTGVLEKLKKQLLAIRK